jgi:hypothetical protein
MPALRASCVIDLRGRGSRSRRTSHLYGPKAGTVHQPYIWYDLHVGESRKITVEVPGDLLDRAQAAIGEGITSTVRRGLELVAATRSLQQLRSLRGKIRFTIELDELREDRR